MNYKSGLRTIGGKFASASSDLGIFDFFIKSNPHRLTVLNYHRINNPAASNFVQFKPNVSASPETFDSQMKYLQQRYQVVSEGDVLKWLVGKGTLPDHAALITFDDGYFDNYQHAAPILRKHGFPALIFLATGYIGTSIPFYWDLVAYCFYNSHLEEISFPLIGRRRMADREKSMRELINALKLVDEAVKNDVVGQLPELMNVSIAADQFAGVTLTWENVLELRKNGIDFGSHTVTHPILTRINNERVQTELEKSREEIELRLDKPVVSIAYPNGKAADFNPQIQAMAKAAGYHLGFSLLAGPSAFREVEHNPWAIRRVYIAYNDSLPVFAAKLSGVAKFLQAFVG